MNSRLTALRLWLRWLVVEGVVDVDPTEGIRKMKEDRKVLATISTQQVHDLLKVCQQQGRAGDAAKRTSATERSYFGDCPDVAGPFNAGLWADVDCDGAVDASDAIGILLWIADFDVPQEDGCTEINELFVS